MKILKPVLFYIGYFLIIFLLLGFYTMGSIDEIIQHYNNNFIILNIFFATLYFYINSPDNYLSFVIIILLSLSLNFTLLEIIYPKTIAEDILLFDDENYIISVDDVDKIDEVNNEKPTDDMEKAQFYFNRLEFSSSFVYADRVLDKDPDNVEAKIILNKSKDSLYSRGEVIDDPKYIETVKFRNLVNQRNYIDAYYFCLKQINGSQNDYDFSIKLNNCYNRLLDNYYPIQMVKSILSRSGYSDIQFYFTKDEVIHYSIHKLVEFEDEYYIKDLKVNGVTYPFIYINKNGKVFSSGFNEDKREVLEYDNPVIPIDPESLKLYSKEYYRLLDSSLKYNIEIAKFNNVKYINENYLFKIIMDRITGYITIILVFLMVFTINDNRGFINEFLLLSLITISCRWYIKNIGSILLMYGLSLSLLFVLLSYSFWIYIIFKKFNPRLSLF